MKVRTFISLWLSLCESSFRPPIQRAQELGAAGVLIYSNLRDGGFVTVKNDYLPYPAGPARNPSSVQRGSVRFLSTYPGDPTTPGYPAYKSENEPHERTFPKSPVYQS